MITQEDIVRAMWIFVPLVVGFTAVCYVVFMRWGRNEHRKNRIRDEDLRPKKDPQAPM